ncbi:hypothetical protein [Streptomyces sp. NPDC055749]
MVRTPFVSGRIDLVLHATKLESRADALDMLDAGASPAVPPCSARGNSVATGLVTWAKMPA